MIATGQKRDYIYRLCAGNNERKKALIRWGTITLVLRMSTVLMRLYTLLIGVCNILSNDLDREKSAHCRNGNHFSACQKILCKKRQAVVKETGANQRISLVGHNPA